LEKREVLSIGLIQARRDSDWKATLSRVTSLASSLKDVDVVMLSENWLSRDPINIELYEEALEKVAHASGATAVLGGTNYVLENERPVSMGLAYISGRIVRMCEKVFPSRAVGERGRIRPGKLYPPVEILGWRLQCIACVGIFYPELARMAVALGANVIYNPASIPSDRLNLWSSTLLVRAAENTVYSVGVNGVGYVYPDGRITLGGSGVYAPNGIVLGRLGSSEETGIFHLYNNLIDNIRNRWAFYHDLTKYILKQIYSNNIYKFINIRVVEDHD